MKSRTSIALGYLAKDVGPGTSFNNASTFCGSVDGSGEKM